MDKLKCWAYSLVLLVVVQCVAFITLILIWRGIRMENAKPTEQTICVPCGNLGIMTESLSERLRGHISTTNNGSNCCGTVSFVLAELVNKSYTDLHDNQANYPGQLLDRVSGDCVDAHVKPKPSAFLKGIAVNDMIQEPGVVHWDHLKDAKMKGGLHYHNGSICINESGLYFVSSQISFKNSHNPLFEQNGSLPEIIGQVGHDITTHSVHQHTSTMPDGIKTLLESHKSKCKEFNENSDGCKASHVGGLFRFEANDKIHVRTSHPWHINHNEKSIDNENHFEMYLVGK